MSHPVNRILDALPRKDQATILCWSVATGGFGVGMGSLAVNLFGGNAIDVKELVSAIVTSSVCLVVFFWPEPFAKLLSKLPDRHSDTPSD